jgi:ATP-dependent DNA ligase
MMSRSNVALKYVAFDLLWLDGADLRCLPLSERRQHLHNVLPKGSSVISEPLSIQDKGALARPRA